MLEEREADPYREPLPEAELAPPARLSTVWLIPLLALAIGGWLAWESYSERGPEIQIAFKSATGLQAERTKVKFKDVEVGQVTRIAVSPDLTHVLVKARLLADSERYLTDKTRFWVARPRVSTTQVTGLETLFSGAYIAIDPVPEGNPAREFVGLDNPPWSRPRIRANTLSCAPTPSAPSMSARPCFTAPSRSGKWSVTIWTETARR
jgi:paraquat-inducible protein B